ncbi:MAG: hypothetical protein ACKVX7_00020 [Planctomycetota bacterium]
MLATRVLTLVAGIGLLFVGAQLNAPCNAQSADQSAGKMADAKMNFDLWPGFVSGMGKNFRASPRPLDSPLYFEDPFIATDIRPIFLYHEFPRHSLLGGGHLTVLAVQARLALTERLALIATEDGYTDLEASALPAGDGWNNLAAGFKYALHVDYEQKSILTAGARWTLSNGSRDVFQGIEDEVSLFVTGAKTMDRIHLMADVVGRITTHHEQGNDSLSWDVQAAYELTPRFFPLVEYHGFTYLSNGNRIQVRDGLLDYGNLGAGDVRGSDVHWATVGYRYEVADGVQWGLGYGFALRTPGKNDIYEERLITGLVFLF